VLAATRQAYKAGKHVEVSTLMVTGISDDEQTARKVAQWVLSDLDSTVPLHYVRFHPDFRMRDSVRTPIPKLLRAREIATGLGVEHVYLGNVYDTPFTNTFCAGCGATLVTRYGLNAKVVGLNGRGHCSRCDRDAHFKLIAGRPASSQVEHLPLSATRVEKFDWRGDIRSVHIQAKNSRAETTAVYHRRRYGNTPRAAWSAISLQAGESYRFILAKAGDDETGVEVAIPDGVDSNLHEVFDRAHFPTIALETSHSATDVSPLPVYPGRQLPVGRGRISD
jgi:pyruvate formate lyase activating enzyme